MTFKEGALDFDIAKEYSKHQDAFYKGFGSPFDYFDWMGDEPLYQNYSAAKLKLKQRENLYKKIFYQDTSVLHHNLGKVNNLPFLSSTTVQLTGNITTGRVYQAVMQRERGSSLGDDSFFLARDIEWTPCVDASRDHKSSYQGAEGLMSTYGPNLLEKAYRLLLDGISVVPRALRPQEGMVESVYDKLAPKMATISLSGFGGSNFGFNGTVKNPYKTDSFQIVHTKPGSYRTLKSIRVSSNFQPIVAEASKIDYTSWSAIGVAGAAFATHAKNFMIDPMMIPIGMIAILAMAANFPLGMGQEHPHEFSPPWLTAILATLPFVPLICALILRPKPSTVFIIVVASVVGHVLGSMAEQARLKAMSPPLTKTSATVAEAFVGVSDPVGVEPPLPPRAEPSVVGGTDRPGVKPDINLSAVLWSPVITANGSTNNFNF